VQPVVTNELGVSVTQGNDGMSFELEVNSCLDAVTFDRPDSSLGAVSWHNRVRAPAWQICLNSTNNKQRSVATAHDEEIRFCIDHHANAYLTKSADAQTTRETIENLLRFWFHKTVMPMERLH